MMIANTNRAAALQAASDAFAQLSAGRLNMSPGEVRFLRRVARRRTDIFRPQSELTAEQAAWRIIHDLLDEQLSGIHGPAAKTQLDDAERLQDSCTTISRALEHSGRRHPKTTDPSLVTFVVCLVLTFGAAIYAHWSWWLSAVSAITVATASLFVTAVLFDAFWSQQILGSYLDRLGRFLGRKTLVATGERLYSRAVGLDEYQRRFESETDLTEAFQRIADLLDVLHGQIEASLETLNSAGPYRSRADELEESMLDQISAPEDRSAAAKLLVDLTTRMYDVGLRPLLELRDELDDYLVDCPKYLAHVSAPEKLEKLQEWYDAAHTLFRARWAQVNYLRARLEWDERIPQRIIENEGNTSGGMPAEFAHEMKECSELFIHADNDGAHAADRFARLSSEVFGYLRPREPIR